MKSIQLRAVLTAAAISLLAPSLLLLAPATARAGAPGWRWPVSGAVITGYRNGDDPYAGGQHRGLEIAAAVATARAAGATPARAGTGSGWRAGAARSVAGGRGRAFGRRHRPSAGAGRHRIGACRIGVGARAAARPGPCGECTSGRRASESPGR